MSTLLKIVLAVGLLLVFTGTTQALVLPADQDLDSPGVPGSYITQVAGTVQIVTGGGAEIGGTSDAGHFAYAELAGDGSITAQVTLIGIGSSPQRRGGLMIRDSLDASAINVADFVRGGDANVAQRRETSGGNTVLEEAAGTASWLRITRSGNAFTISYSTTGSTWVDYPTAPTIRMDGTIFVGLAVTSNADSEADAFQFRNLSFTFNAAKTLTWNELGDNFWDTANWLGSPPAFPDRGTNAVLAATNTDTVTVQAPAEALNLTVDGGDLVVDAGQTLTVFGQANVGTGGLIELNPGAMLDVFGGDIAKMAAWRGDSTIFVQGDLTVSNLQGNGIFPGTMTKLGPGTLRLDNSPTGGVFADTTTFLVDAGTLASKGAKPLGNAPEVILDGATLALDNGTDAIDADTAVSLTADSTVNVTSAGASLGALNLENAVTLTTSGTGGVAFDATNIAAGVAAVTFNTGMDTGSGPLNLDVTPVVINKTGAAKLVVAGLGANMANATFNVQQGALVAVHSSNPVEGAAITLNGGELILANNGPDDPAVFDNAVTVAASSTLTGGKAGLPVGGAPNVTLGGVNGLNVAANQTLTVRTTDNYMLNIAGALAGSGTMTMTGGTVALAGGGTLGRLNVNDGTLNATSPLTIPDVRAGGGVLNTSAQLDASTRLRATGGTTNIGAVLNTATLDVRGGVVNTTGVVNATTVLASGGALNLNGPANATDAKLSGSALVSASQLVLTSSLRLNELKPNEVVYSVNSGSMTASGANLLAGVNLAFGGNTLTVRGPVPIPGNGLQGLWTFNEDTANDSSGNGRNGVLTNGAYSSDVKGTLGGRSLDLTSGDSYVVVDASGSQDVFNAHNGMTISAWSKGWPDGSWEPFLSKGGESGQGWQVRRRSGSSNDLAFTTRGIGADDDMYDGSSAQGNDRDNWHLFTATYDGLRRRLYIDGVLTASDSSDRPGPVANTTSKLVFGARDASGWGGGIESISHVRLDDIYFYDRALNQTEIAALFNNVGFAKPALDLTSTNLSVTDNATLVADTQVGTATFGNLAVAAGKALTLTTGAPDGFSFGNLTAGDGASIVGNKVLIRDEASVGSSPGVLDVIGNLTLAGTSVYAWEPGDVINVSGKLTLKDGWTLKIVTSEPFVFAKHVLFTYGTVVAPSIPNFDVSEAPGWSAHGLELEVDRAGNVLLAVPEPATLALLLMAGLAGLLYARRRRQAA